MPLPSSPSASIYLHAHNICELGNDVLTLELTNRLRASRILVRPMLESLFSLVAAAEDPAFPVKKIVAEQEEQIERFKKWIEEDHYDEFQDGLEEGKRKVRDLRQKHSICHTLCLGKPPAFLIPRKIALRCEAALGCLDPKSHPRHYPVSSSERRLSKPHTLIGKKGCSLKGYCSLDFDEKKVCAHSALCKSAPCLTSF